LLSSCGIAGDSLASEEALATLSREVRCGLETAEKTAANSEKEHWEAKLVQVRAESGAIGASKLAHLDECRASLQAELHALELELRLIQDRSRDGAERATEVHARKDHLKQVSERLRHAKEECSLAAANTCAIHAKLDESKLASTNVEQNIRKDVQIPLHREVLEVNSQIELLHPRLGSDFEHQEAAWKKYLQKCEHEMEAKWCTVEVTLQEKVSAIQQELSKSMDDRALPQSHDTMTESVREQLSDSLREMHQASSELALTRTRLADLVATTAVHRDAIRIVERRTAEVSDARRREALEATEAERAAARRHAEAMARAKQQCDVDSANLEADARFSLGSLARRITAADGGTALQTHAELTAKAERLAQRAKTHLAAQ